MSAVEDPYWFIFGEHKDGKVDVADVDGDILTHVDRQEAIRVCMVYNNLINKYEELRSVVKKYEPQLMSLSKHATAARQLERMKDAMKRIPE